MKEFDVILMGRSTPMTYIKSKITAKTYEAARDMALQTVKSGTVVDAVSVANFYNKVYAITPTGLSAMRGGKPITIEKMGGKLTATLQEDKVVATTLVHDGDNTYELQIIDTMVAKYRSKPKLKDHVLALNAAGSETRPPMTVSIADIPLDTVNFASGLFRNFDSDELPYKVALGMDGRARAADQVSFINDEIKHKWNVFVTDDDYVYHYGFEDLQEATLFKLTFLG